MRYYFDLRDGEEVAVDDEVWSFPVFKPCMRRPRCSWPTWQETPSESIPTTAPVI
jgi:hypothetical protein